MSQIDEGRLRAGAGVLLLTLGDRRGRKGM